MPRDVRAYSGLAFMGGPMSANDELPWIAPVLELLRDAVRRDVPVIGHCLGGAAHVARRSAARCAPTR